MIRVVHARSARRAGRYPPAARGASASARSPCGRSLAWGASRSPWPPPAGRRRGRGPQRPPNRTSSPLPPPQHRRVSFRRQTTVSRPHLSSVFSLAFTFDVQIETLGCCSSRFQPNVLGQERRGLGVPAATISCSVPNCFRCSSWLSRDLADAPTTFAQRSWRRKRHVLQPIASAARRALRARYMIVVVG